MKQNQEWLSEILNAYLDGELDPAEAARLERRLAADARLRRHVAELRRVRVLVRDSFPMPAPAAPRGAWRFAGRLALGTAAAVLLVATGVLFERLTRPAPLPGDLRAYLPPGVTLIQPANLSVETPTGDTRAIFHVSSADPAQIARTLDHLERVIRGYTEAGRLLRIELVANAEGLDLLRVDRSPAAARVAELRNRYENLRFLACGTTVLRLKRERGQDVPLLPQAEVVPSALDQIILRLREGWTYVRI